MTPPPLGLLTLHRFNGDEVFTVAEADILYFVREDDVSVDFKITTNQTPVKMLPDTEILRGWPNGQWQFFTPEFDPDQLIGKTFSIPLGYDAEQDEAFRACFYYVDHGEIDDNQITVLERDGDRFLVRITGSMPDVNYYDGAKPLTRIVVEASFCLIKSEEPIPPLG